METTTIELKIVLVDLPCDCGHGHLHYNGKLARIERPTGEMPVSHNSAASFTTIPPGYVHVCTDEDCDNEVILTTIYPYVKFIAPVPLTLEQQHFLHRKFMFV